MKKIESGRSMIEMLGVLAIVGVLSIGGLAGYQMAMNRYRASALSDYASRCVVVGQTKTMDGRIANSGTEGNCVTILGGEATPDFGGTATAADNPNGQVTVTFSSIPTAVQTVLEERFGDSTIGGVSYANSIFTFGAS